MNKIKTHKDLEVFQLSFSSGMEVFEMTKSFSKEETYSKLYQKYDWIIGMIINMINKPEKWKVL